MDFGYVYKITFSGKLLWSGNGWVNNYQNAMLMTYQTYTEKWNAVERIIIKFEHTNNFL